MAKVTMIFEDQDDGPQITFIPEPHIDLRDEESVTDAQKLAVKAFQMITELIEESSDEAVIDITGLEPDAIH